MKRRIISLLLTAVMVVGIIPASLLSAWAHGTGVGKDSIENLSINNAPSQALPATVSVDGVDDDSAWDHDNWQVANAGTGVWDAVYYRSTDFSFKYQVRCDYEYLYGIVVLDTKEIYNGELGEITIWLNDDSANTAHYTAKVVLNVTENADGTVSVAQNRYLYGSDTAVTEKDGTLAIESHVEAAKIVDGVVTVEFRSLINVISSETLADLKAYVSVETLYEDGSVSQLLYHPRFDAAVDVNDIDPAKAWPATAVHVEQREIYDLSSADYSEVYPNQVNVDGKLTEAAWAPLTTFSSSGLDRYEFRAEKQDEQTGYEVINFDGVKYNAKLGSWTGTVKGETDGDDMPIKYKYEVRYDKNCIYGAVVAYADYYAFTKLYGVNADQTYGDNEQYFMVPLVLTIGFAEVTEYDENGVAKETSVGSKPLVITHYTELEKKSDYYYVVNNQWVSGCNFGNTKVNGGAKRVNQYLVEFEFQIPIETFLASLTNEQAQRFKDGAEWSYVLAVNTCQWDCGNVDESDHVTDSKVYSHPDSCSEVYTLSGYYTEQAKAGDKFKKTNAYATDNWTADGTVDTNRWAALKAADKYIDSMQKSSGKYDSAEHMAYEVFTDDNYLYGVALIEDGKWALGNTQFNIWLNNGVPTWRDVYDAKLSFSLDDNENTRVQLTNHYFAAEWQGDTVYNGTENMLTGIYNAYENSMDGYNALKARGFILRSGFDSATGVMSDGAYASKWLQHPSESVYTQGVSAVMQTIKTEGNNASRTVLLEFKVPLEMLCISEKAEVGDDDVAFTYVASVGSSDGTYEMMHPMASNSVLYNDNQRTNGTYLTGEYKSQCFYPRRWNPTEANFYRTGDRYTNNVADGKLQEDFWDQTEEMIYVDGDTGLWATPPQGEEHIDYYYNVYATREWLYGAAIINDDANTSDTTFTLWLNNDVTTTASGTATGRFEISLLESGEPVCEFYDAAGNVVYTFSGVNEEGVVLFDFTEKRAEGGVTGSAPADFVNESSFVVFEKTVNYGYGSMKTLDGKTYVEFKINLDKFISDHEGKGHTEFNFNKIGGYDQIDYLNTDSYYIEPREAFEYCVSVTHEDNVLYYLGGDVYNMWVTHVNADLSQVGGNIINDTAKIRATTSANFDTNSYYVLLCPSELENVYRVEAMVVDAANATDEQKTAWDALVAAPHTGAFIYKVTNTDGNNRPYHMTIGSTESYHGAIFDKLFADDNYVEFFDFNANGTTVEEVAGIASRDHITYLQNGYYNKAAFTAFAMPDDINVKQNSNTAYPHSGWTDSTAYVVDILGLYTPERITVDGYLNDSGWDDSKWITVSNDINGNTQNPGQELTPFFEYQYQMRTDGDEVYIAVVMDHDPEYTAAPYDKENSKTWWSSPQFRIWIQSNGDEYSDAISFTHLYDIRLGSEIDPNTNSSTSGGNVQTTLTVDKYDYTKANLPFTAVSDAGVHEGLDNVKVEENSSDSSKVNVTYEGVTLRFAEHRHSADGEYFWNEPHGGRATSDGTTTTWDQTNGFGLDSLFYGETKVVAENTSSGAGNPYTSDSWFAAPEITKYTYGNEHAAYNTVEDGSKVIIEFKFGLDEIGTDSEKGFNYYVQCSSIASSTTNAFVLFHPNYTIEADVGSGAYDGYYYPFWVWGDNAFVCDKQWFYDNDLNNPKDPVTPLGGQYIEDYMGRGTAIRFGVLYNQNYVDDVYGETDATTDVYSNATYWDVKEIGLLLGSSKNFQLDEKTNDVALYETTSKVKYIYADMIINRVPDTNMADYESHVFYAVLSTKGHEDDDVTCRGIVEYYPSDDIYYNKDTLPGSKDKEGNIDGYTFRPTFYSATVTRSYNMIKNGATKFGNGNHMTDEIIDEYKPKIDADKTTVAYIPLDDRPVNDQRVQYLAQAVGINLIMPPEEYYTNTLDNDGLGFDGDSDSGNPLQLLSWLENEAACANYYIISLDMMFSGGLIGSRAPEVDTDYDDDATKPFTYISKDGTKTIENYSIGSVENGEYQLSEGERAIMDYLIDLAANESKHVVFFDTVVRLASTTYYGNYTIGDYNGLRECFADLAREQLYGTDLTIENIVAGYNKDENGNIISTDGVNATDGTYSTNKIAEYMETRQRKLTIIDELLSSTGDNGKPTIDNIDRLIIGVDDSKPQTTIQTNEVRYIEEKLVQGRKNTTLMAAADELGLLGVSDVITTIYGKVHVNLQYFGPGQNEPADEFDNGTLAKTTKTHIITAGGYFDYSEKDGLNVLVLTKADSTAEIAANAKALINRAKYNLANDIPTCIIDAANNDGILASLMIGVNYEGMSSSVFDASYKMDNIGLLMGYSEWNTTANSLGIALSNAIARYSYLENSSNITKESHYGFMKVITHAFVKDIAYRENSTNGALFYEKAPILTDMINASQIYVGEIGVEGSRVDPFTYVKVSDLYFPWDRHFEADFTISFLEKSYLNVAHKDNGYVTDVWLPNLPDTNGNINTLQGRYASINDGVITNGGAGYPTHWTDNTWYEMDSSEVNTEGKYIKFTFNDKIDLGLMRIHMGISYSGIQQVRKLTVYGSNDGGVTWTQVGQIEPKTSSHSVDSKTGVEKLEYTGDYMVPDGNSNPGTYYCFYPEITYYKDVDSYTGIYDVYNDDLDKDEVSYWSTVPLNCGEGYSMYKIDFFGYAAHWFDEVQFIRADENYSDSYILPCE